jgi:putative transposase
VSGNLYRGHRFPKEIISYCVWFYFRFSVSFRDVEEMMASRGVPVSYETVRRWCDKFGHEFAARVRRRRPQTGDKWHLDEVFLKINGVTHYLWRAVDQNGVVIDILVQPKRDRFAAMRFFGKLLRPSRVRPRDCNGQAAQLWRRETDRDAGCCSPTAPAPKQSGRELSSTDA